MTQRARPRVAPTTPRIERAGGEPAMIVACLASLGVVALMAAAGFHALGVF